LDNADKTNQDVSIVVKGAGLSLMGKVVGRFLSFVSDIILTRVLGAGIFGLYSIGWTLFRIFQMVVPLGLPQGVIRYIPEFQHEGSKEKTKGLILGAFIISFCFGLIFGALFYLSSTWLSNSIFHKPDLLPVLQLFSLVFPFCPFLFISASLFRSQFKMSYSVLLEDIGQPLLGLLIVISCVVLSSLSYKNVIISELFSFIITGLIGIFITVKLFKPVFSPNITPNLAPLNPVLAYSIPTSLAGVFSVIVFWVDRLIVGILLPASENGIYQILSQLSMIFVIFYASFNSILGPTFSNLFAQNDKKRLQEIYRVGTKWNFYLGIIPFIVILLKSSCLLGLIYGNEFTTGAIALIVLSFGQLINCATGSIGALLMMTGHQKSWFWMTTVSLIVNTLICFLLVPEFGLLGAALGTSISVGGMNIAATFYARNKLGLWPYDRRYIKGIISGLIALIFGLIVMQIKLPDWASFISVCFVTFIIFALFLFVLRFDQEDIILFNEIEKRLGLPSGIFSRSLKK
jgi:O-antigen/teichoic acid export membrane protein